MARTNKDKQARFRGSRGCLEAERDHGRALITELTREQGALAKQKLELEAELARLRGDATRLHPEARDRRRLPQEPGRDLGDPPRLPGAREVPGAGLAACQGGATAARRSRGQLYLAIVLGNPVLAVAIFEQALAGPRRRSRRGSPSATPAACSPDSPQNLCLTGYLRPPVQPRPRTSSATPCRPGDRTRHAAPVAVFTACRER